MTTDKIDIANLSFKYDEQNILDDITLSIPKGQFSVLIGPNGGGKTTLLKLLLGFITPNKGSISIFGSSPKDFRPKMAYVPQYLSFDRAFPISLINLILMGALHNHKWYRGYAKDDKEMAYTLLDQMDLSDKASMPIGALSGGQLQRGLIARALLSSPKILMLDEPTSNIDSKSESILYRQLEQLAGEMTILLVSHDLKSISNPVDKILYVHNKIDVLEPSDVCSHYSMGVYHPPFSHKKEESS